MTGERLGGRTAFSANLGTLWTELPLPEAIRAAARAGFDAVGCHAPYDVPAAEVSAALATTGLPLLSINTRRGPGPGSFGRAAIPNRGREARADIDEAVAYAAETGARAIHVLAGKARGDDARATYLSNLSYACGRAAPFGITILIEPLNGGDVPGYHLSSTADAARIIAGVAAPNLRLLFDCYHVQLIEGDVAARLEACLPDIGHVQTASVPDRGPLDQGEIDYFRFLPLLRDLGWDRPVGVEYCPRGRTEDSLGWLAALR